MGGVALLEWLDPKRLIEAFGLIGIGALVFAESGVLLGLFLPGDSLLFTAGILAAADTLPLLVLLPLVFVAAAAGDSVGYAFGRRAGPALYRRPDSRVFKQEHLQHAREFYERRGGSTILLARFIPIVRTLAPVVAGIAGMRYRRFVGFNLIGAALWGIGVTLLGYALGSVIPDIDRYLLPVIAVIVLISVTPVIREVRKRRTSGSSAAPRN
ncbi:MAG TPA: VTT domain-containing protein [Actinomycetota bacterium]|nr:VTT domain-containing protein [Actinomycetota bacterium]